MNPRDKIHGANLPLRDPPKKKVKARYTPVWKTEREKDPYLIHKKKTEARIAFLQSTL